jgi:hypothetical protein
VDRFGKTEPLLSGAVGYVLNRFKVPPRGSYVENVGRAGHHHAARRRLDVVLLT